MFILQTGLNIHLSCVFSPKVSVVLLKWSYYFLQQGCSDDGGPCRKSFPVRTILHRVWCTRWWPQHSGSPGAGRAGGQHLSRLKFPGKQRSIRERRHTLEPSVPVPHRLPAADSSGQHTSAATRQHLLTSAVRLLLRHPPLCPPALLPTDRSLSLRARTQHELWWIKDLKMLWKIE